MQANASGSPTCVVVHAWAVKTSITYLHRAPVLPVLLLPSLSCSLIPSIPLVRLSINILGPHSCPFISQAPNNTTYRINDGIAHDLTYRDPNEDLGVRHSGRRETILQYADPDGIDAALLLPANPALSLLLACRKTRDEIMSTPKPILSIVIDDLDMLEALQFSAYSTRKAIGRIRFTGYYVSYSEERIAWWSGCEERSRTPIVRHCYSEWKTVYSTLGRNEYVGGNDPYHDNRKAFEIQFDVSGAREPIWNVSLQTNEYRRIFSDRIPCTMPGCGRLGAAPERLLSVRVQLMQAAQEERRLARLLAQDD